MRWVNYTEHGDRSPLLSSLLTGRTNFNYKWRSAAGTEINNSVLITESFSTQWQRGGGLQQLPGLLRYYQPPHWSQHLWSQWLYSEVNAWGRELQIDQMLLLSQPTCPTCSCEPWANTSLNTTSNSQRAFRKKEQKVEDSLWKLLKVAQVETKGSV